MKLAVVTGSLAPYTSRLYTAFAEQYGVDITVMQCATVEPGRNWHLPGRRRFRLMSLPGFRRHRSDVSHIYFNPSVIAELIRLKPDRILIDSFSPTMMLAALYGIATRTPFVLGIEGGRDIDPGERSLPHAMARCFFARWAGSGSCTSEAACEMMASWGLPRERTAIVPHAGSWPAPASIRNLDERRYDLLLCGTLNDRKNPLFLADVIDRLAAEGLRLSVRIVGDGVLRGALADRLAAAGVEARFEGYLQQEAIIDAFQSAKVLAFPTKADTWGLVANEALLCGTPVLASPHAVSSRELCRPSERAWCVSSTPRAGRRPSNTCCHPGRSGRASGSAVTKRWRDSVSQAPSPAMQPFMAYRRRPTVRRATKTRAASRAPRAPLAPAEAT